MKKIILASRSPRRIELLKLICDDFTVMPSAFDENTITANTPQQLVRELSFNKAKTVLEANCKMQIDSNYIVIGCDTVVALNDKVFGIPNDRSEAFATIKALSGKEHVVLTGVCILTSTKRESFEVKTKVKFYSLTDDQINLYLDTPEPYDKAGAYGIQGKGALFVEHINGDYYNVVGLPVAKVSRRLEIFL